MSDSQSGQWSERKKWCLDFLKSIILFGLAVTVSVTLLNRLDADLQLKRQQIEFIYEYDLRLLEKFEGSAHMLIAGAYDAYEEHMAGKTRETSDSIKRYSDTLYDNYRASLEVLRRRFKNRPALSGFLGVSGSAQLDEVEEKQRKMYDWFSTKSADLNGFKKSREEFRSVVLEFIASAESDLEKRWRDAIANEP